MILRIGGILALLLLGAARPVPLPERVTNAVNFAWQGNTSLLASLLDRSFTAGKAVSGTVPGYLGSYKAVAQAFPSLTLSSSRTVVEGGGIVVQQRLTGVRSGYLGGTPPTNRRETFSIEQRFDFENGAITAAAITTDLFERRPLPAFGKAAGRQATPLVQEVATFHPGAFPEGLVVGPDGTAYVSMLFTNEIWAVRPGGKPEIVARLPFQAAPPPIAQGLFCLALAPDGSLYASVAGGPRVGGVWRVTLGGGAELVAELPLGAAPNGIALASNGQLYVADTFAGRIWKVDPGRRTASVWIDAPVLKARPFVGTYPGVNGVQTDGRAVFATISDTALLVRVPILANGSAGRPTIVSNQIAGDDFAIDQDGSLLVTTHPFNTVERVAPDGRRTLLAGPAQGVIGPVTAALARKTSGARVLYVATDGGLYAPVPGQAPIAKLLRIILDDLPPK